MACAVSTSAAILDERLSLGERVAVRPEPFGALLYNYDTRRMSFLKDRRLSEIVRGLDAASSARAACRAAGVDDADLATYARALRQLVDSKMIRVGA